MEQRKMDSEAEERKRLERLEREGKVKLGSGGIPDEFWQSGGPEDPEGLARRYLIEDRR